MSNQERPTITLPIREFLIWYSRIIEFDVDRHWETWQKLSQALPRYAAPLSRHPAHGRPGWGTAEVIDGRPLWIEMVRTDDLTFASTWYHWVECHDRNDYLMYRLRSGL